MTIRPDIAAFAPAARSWNNEVASRRADTSITPSPRLVLLAAVAATAAASAAAVAFRLELLVMGVGAGGTEATTEKPPTGKHAPRAMHVTEFRPSACKA
jgi:hypothetical protein